MDMFLNYSVIICRFNATGFSDINAKRQIFKSLKLQDFYQIKRHNSKPDVKLENSNKVNRNSFRRTFACSCYYALSNIPCDRLPSRQPA
jgi:hypothetical protein